MLGDVVWVKKKDVPIAKPTEKESICESCMIYLGDDEDGSC